MAYSESKTPKMLAGFAAISTVLIFVLAPYWGGMKRSYFEYVLQSCGERYDLRTIPWQRRFIFDGYRREFVAKSGANLATIECTNRWAGLIIRDEIHEIDEYAPVLPMLVVTTSGSNLAPPKPHFDIAYIEPVRTGPLED